MFVRRNACSFHCIDVREQCRDAFMQSVTAALGPGVVHTADDDEFVLSLTFKLTNVDECSE